MSALPLLARLVAADSTSHLSTREVEVPILEALDHPAIRTHRFDCDNEKSNLVFEVGRPSKSGEGLTLAGHMDCVPAHEPDWITPARELSVRNGRAYGRGACDMKGFDAIAIRLVREAAERGVSAPLALILTCDEEQGAQGAPRLAAQWSNKNPLPRRTIVGEPTMLRPIRGHKGFAWYRLTVAGRPAHTSCPTVGDSAIRRAMPLLAELDRLRQELSSVHCIDSSLFEESAFPILTVGMIQGGVAINVEPPSCTINVGIRCLPEQHPKDCTQWIVDVTERAQLIPVFESPAVHHAPGFCAVESICLAPGFHLAQEHPWTREMCELTGVSRAIGAPYATDAGALTAMGLDCIVCGPGDILQAHRANEFVELEQLDRCEALLRRLIQWNQ